MGGDRREKLKTRAQELVKQLEKLRELKFKEEVRFGVKTEAELLSALEKITEEEMPEEKILGIQRAYAKMGLLPRDMNLKKTFLDVLKSQVAGFYNPKTKNLFLIDRTGGGGKKDPMAAMMEMALSRFGITLDDLVTAHELTHALQDQHFDLQRMEKRGEGNDDRILALKSVFEGDAFLTMWEPVVEKVPFIRRMLNNLGRMEGMGGGLGGGMGAGMEDVPAILKVPLAFPYMGGAKLVGRAREKGGWKAVNALFTDLPLSTEQVLHIEKYFDDRDDPVFIDFENPKAWLPEGWTPLESNSLGELGSRILLDEFLSKAKAEAAAEGWDGDRFAAFAKGKAVCFFWYSTWDEKKEAREFARAYVGLLRKKYKIPKETKVDLEGEEIRFTFSTQGEHGCLTTRGCDVVVIEGLPPEETAALQERLFREVKKRGPGKPAEGKPDAHRIRGKGFTVTAPPGWGVDRPGASGRMRMTAPEGKGRIEFGVLPLQDPSLEEVLSLLQKAIAAKYAERGEVRTTRRTFKGKKGAWIRFQGEDPKSGLSFRYAMRVVLRERDALVVTIAGPADDGKGAFEAGQGVLKSLEWD
ncbi:MAG: hypothetical protein ACYTHM_01040 [Planctomycetota bacterium]